MWRNLLVGGTIAITPVVAIAADKDDRDRSSRKGQPAVRQGSVGNPPRGGTSFSKSPSEKAKTSFRSVDDSAKNSAKGAELRRNQSQLQPAGKKTGDSNGNKTRDRGIDSKSPVGSGKSNDLDRGKHRPGLGSGRDSNMKAHKTDHGNKPGNDVAGKKSQNGSDNKGDTPNKRPSNKGVLDTVKPENLKKFEKHADVAKMKAGKNGHKDDVKFVHGNHKEGGKKVGNFLDEHKKGKFDGITKGAVAKKLDLGKQFELKHKGDLTLKLNLSQKVKMHGGWSKSHWAGLIGPSFGVGCAPIVYCGPGYFPSHCLYPGWTPWVQYCWSFRCDPIYDPRPWTCRPWVYDPCPVWVRWEYPVWYELPVVASGTWIDVEPVVIDEGLDLQLLAVRFVDPGQQELNEGPRYRIWARNNSTRSLVKDFNIVLMAANNRVAVDGLPQAGVRVDSMEPGEIKAFDVRLPSEVAAMARDSEGNATPFSQLHVLVDSHREVLEAFEENNGAVIARADVLPVDPVIFGTDTVTPVPGTEINIAGEGFGPEPGQVLVHVGGIELQAEIDGWCDLGVRIKLPALALAGPTDAEVVLIRGDTAASNPLSVQLTLPVALR
jgi:hypothetical protein